MAESSLSQSGTNSSPLYDNPVPSSLKFLMASLKAVAAVSLIAENYPIWSSQVLKLFTANNFDDFLTGANPCPPQFTLTSTGEPLLNPDYKHWKMVDQNLTTALYSTISIFILPYVLNLDTTTAIWQTLVTRLQSTCRSRVIQLKNELHHLSLKNSSMTQYLMEVKSVVDRISAVGANLDAEDIILYIMDFPPPTNPSKQQFEQGLNPLPWMLYTPFSSVRK